MFIYSRANIFTSSHLIMFDFEFVPLQICSYMNVRTESQSIMFMCSHVHMFTKINLIGCHENNRNY